LFDIDEHEHADNGTSNKVVPAESFWFCCFSEQKARLDESVTQSHLNPLAWYLANRSPAFLAFDPACELHAHST
jgi:hypothetical protein